MASVETFWNLGHQITKHDPEGSITVGYRKFRAFFGTSPMVCVAVWDILLMRRSKKSKPENLLWALMFLKQYNIESLNSAMVGVSEKTFQKWSHTFIQFIANMQVEIKILPLLFLDSVVNIFEFFYRLIGRSVSKTLQEEHQRSFLLTGTILESWNLQNSIVNGGPTT